MRPSVVESEPRDGEIVGGVARGDVAEVDERDEPRALERRDCPDAGRRGSTRVSDPNAVRRARHPTAGAALRAPRPPPGRAVRRTGSTIASARSASGTPRTGLTGWSGGGADVQCAAGRRPADAAHPARSCTSDAEPARPLEPRHDRPRPRIAGARSSAHHRRRNADAGRSEPRGDAAQNLLLVQHEGSGEGATGESHGELVAQPPHRAVPPVGDVPQRKSRGIRDRRRLGATRAHGRAARRSRPPRRACRARLDASGRGPTGHRRRGGSCRA